MNPAALDALDHADICAWLERALADQEPLPKLTPDESPYLGILRLDKQVKSPTRNSLYSGCLRLLTRFCEASVGELAYVRNLLSLAVDFGDAQTPEILGNFVQTSPHFPLLTPETRFAILGALVDAPPPRAPEFWREVLRQDREHYALMALSGVLGTWPFPAIQMLPDMPDHERKGQAAAIKIDLAWNALPGDQRFKFACAVQSILDRCGARFAAPLYVWAEARGVPAVPKTADSPLRRALQSVLNFDSTPQVWTSKLCAC